MVFREGPFEIPSKLGLEPLVEKWAQITGPHSYRLFISDNEIHRVRFFFRLPGLVEIMFELSDFAKAQPTHKPIPRSSLVDDKHIQGYGAADEAEYAFDKSKFEDGEIFSYFKSRRISRKWIQFWMFLQVALLILQVFLFREVSSHASTYNTVVHAACKETEAGTCKSRLWQVRYVNTYHIDPMTLDHAINFKFTAMAWAPYELQLSVISVPNEMRIPYELVLKRHASGNAPEETFYEYRTTGVSAVDINQRNTTGFNARDLFKGKLPQPAEWEGTIRLAQNANIGHFGYRHSSPMYERIKENIKSVRVIVNEMVSLESRIFQREAPMCDLDPTWNNVVLKSMSTGSGRLEWVSALLGWSILGSAIVTALVWAWFSGRRLGEGVGALKFHYLVAAKGVVQDIPLQGLILWYIFSWYEGAGGERCQLCILDVRHCEHMTPFHLSTFSLIFVVLCSAISNQFLFSTDPAQLRTEDDQGFVVFVRIMLGCVMILPFSTAMVAFNGSLVDLPGLVHTVFLLPCFAGWVAFFSLLCFPIASLVDDDDLLTY
jgi:hypothetical protein